MMIINLGLADEPVRHGARIEPQRTSSPIDIIMSKQ